MFQLPSVSASQPMDENGRRTQSLDGNASAAQVSRQSSGRRQSSGSAQTRSRSRSLGRAKKKPEALEESYASSSSSVEVEEVEASPAPINPRRLPTLVATSSAKL